MGHRLACGALAPERVNAAAVVVHFSPELKGDPAEMHALNRLGETINARASGLTSAVDEPVAFMVKHQPGPSIRLGKGLLPAADQEVLADRRAQQVFWENVREQFRQGAAGLNRDRRLDRTWGFDPGRISIRVSQWHGDEDRNVPLSRVGGWPPPLQAGGLRFLPVKATCSYPVIGPLSPRPWRSVPSSQVGESEPSRAR